MPFIQLTFPYLDMSYRSLVTEGFLIYANFTGNRRKLNDAKNKVNRSDLLSRTQRRQHRVTHIFPHMLYCSRVALVSPVSGQRPWRRLEGTSCRRNADKAAVWAPCCGSSTCKQSRCPSAQCSLAVSSSSSPPPRTNSPPRSPR